MKSILNDSKKLIKFTGIACVALALALPAQALVSTESIIKRTLALVGVVEDRDYQVLLCQVDNVRSDQRSSQTYTLEAGETYKILAIGDAARVSDIDLEVLDENGNSIGKDDDEQNIAEVTITPKWSGRFKFVVDPYRMIGGASDAFFSLVVARKAN